MLRFLIHLSLALLIGSHSGFCADLLTGRFTFASYGSHQGLGNLAVRRLIQDPDGFIWVGTEDGLYRFDGMQFKAFGMKDGLPSAFIETLGLDAQGQLWVGTYRGLVRFDGRKFHPVPLSEEAARVTGLALDRHHRVWIATDNGLLHDGPQGFTLDPAWPGGPALALANAPDGTLWSAQGTTLLRRTEGHGTAMWSPQGEITSGAIRFIGVDPQGSPWVIGPRGIWGWNPSGRLWRVAGFEPLTRDRLGRPTGPPIWDPSGRLWLPCTGGAAFMEQGVWRSFSRANGLPIAFSNALLADREGHIWIGGTGLHRLLGEGSVEAITSLEGLPEDCVRGVWKGASSEILIGTDTGLAVWNNRKWIRPSLFVGKVIRASCLDPDGTRYLAGHSPDVFAWPSHGEPFALSLPAGLLGTGRIFDLAWLDHRLWVATENGGLVSLRKSAEGWVGEREVLPSETPSERFSDLYIDSSHRLWATGSLGLGLRTPDGRWLRFGTSDGLERNHVAYLLQRASGEYLIAYFDGVGITRFQLDGERLRVTGRLDQASGLRSNKVYSMLEDHTKRLWVGTGLGLTLFNRPPDYASHLDFTNDQGLASEDCNALALMEDASGDVWVGTGGGLIHLRNAWRQTHPSPPPTRILASSFKTRTSLGDQWDGIPESKVTRSPANTFNVQFAALGFHSSGIEHRVRLLGLETTWHLTSSHEARFPGLEPGRYRFEVQSRYPFGDWGALDALEFTVKPHLWQTWWFRIVAAALVLVLSASAIRRHIRLIRQQGLSDPLTGLRNRRSLDREFIKDVELTKRRYALWNHQVADPPSNQDLIFYMVDIDHFKLVNDTYGHATGDRVLKRMAKILLQASRGSDSVIRWGGEEFLLIARQADRRQAQVVAERIRSSVAREAFESLEGHHIPLTCSVGFCPFPLQPGFSDALSWEETVGISDQCLYAAKRSGRNLWVGLQAKNYGLLHPDAQNASAYSIPAWIEEELVEIQTNHPHPQAMVWDLVGSL